MNHWIKLLAALAASALVASIAAAFALAGGATRPAEPRLTIGKSPLGRILVDSKGITLYDFSRTRARPASATAPARLFGRRF